jgi:hypothetical protein
MKRSRRRTIGSMASAGLATSVTLGALAVTTAAAQAQSRGYMAYHDAGYTYCDATLLAAAWGTSVDKAKIAIGGKVLNHWSAAEIDQAIAPGRRGHRCSFVDEGYTFQDAQALGRYWGISPSAAKTKIERMLTAGKRVQVPEIVEQARRS